MGTNDIKILFFDIGGVMLSNGWGHESRRAAAEKFGLDYEEMKELHTFILMCTKAEVLRWMNTLIRSCLIIRAIFRVRILRNLCMRSLFEMDTLQWLKEWKKDCGFRIISINNEGKELNDYRVKKFKLHEFF